jgi:hypothetical protein
LITSDFNAPKLAHPGRKEYNMLLILIFIQEQAIRATGPRAFAPQKHQLGERLDP